MREVGCLFTLLESGDQRCKKGTRGAGGEKGGFEGLCKGKHVERRKWSARSSFWGLRSFL